MLFENEKDILDNVSDLHIDEDGTVTWDDVLNNPDDDDVLAPKKAAPAQQSPSGTVDLGGDLELVPDIEEDITEENLVQFLEDEPETTPKQKAFEAFSGPAESEIEYIENNDDDYINEQLQNIEAEESGIDEDEDEDEPEEIIIPRKTERKTSSGSPVFLIAILFALIVVGGVYYILNYTKDKNVNDDVLPVAPSVQSEMDNTTQEDIANRNKDENIPVVNEEQVNEVKPDEAEEADKKQVVDVKAPTGRPNPFMPIAKYATKGLDTAIVMYDKTGIPAPPKEFGEEDMATTKMLTISVSGIMYDQKTPSAIITLDGNDYFVQRGDKLDNYKVLDITKNCVTISLGKNIYKANVGEEFKIETNFYGNNQYLTKQQGGGRQYHTVESGMGGAPGYVSERDIQINGRRY